MPHIYLHSELRLLRLSFSTLIMCLLQARKTAAAVRILIRTIRKGVVSYNYYENNCLLNLWFYLFALNMSYELSARNNRPNTFYLWLYQLYATHETHLHIRDRIRKCTR